MMKRAGQLSQREPPTIENENDDPAPMSQIQPRSRNPGVDVHPASQMRDSEVAPRRLEPFLECARRNENPENPAGAT